MNYSSLEEAYGSPFGQRAPITHGRKDAKEEPISKPEFASMEKRSEEAVKKNQSIIDSLKDSLPLDENPITENFVAHRVEKRQQIRENFTSPPPTPVEHDDKLSRILRLIEQNRTGYEQPAIQDMALYIFTGVFFIFTLDTFVMIGKGMRKFQRT